MRRVIAAIFLTFVFSGASLLAADRDPLHGLKAELFSGANFEKKILERVDPNIDFHWAYAAPAALVPEDYFSIRWSGYIKAPQAGRYNLILSGDDGIRLTLDGQKLIDEWRPDQYSKSVAIDLTGKPQKILVEYCEHNRYAWVSLRWKTITADASQIIGSEFLFPDEKSALARGSRAKEAPRTGLVAEYFDPPGKKKLAVERVYHAEAVWGNDRPMPGVPHDASVRYTGFLVPPKSGKYKFVAFADDRARIWIDGKLLLEVKIDTAGGKGEAFVDLKENAAHTLLIEFADEHAWGMYYLHWVLPDEEQELPIPCECLYPTKQAVPKVKKKPAT